VNHSFPSVSEILQPTTLIYENELKPIEKNKQLKVGVGKAMSVMATVWQKCNNISENLPPPSMGQIHMPI
jgi:hypothetical protein